MFVNICIAIKRFRVDSVENPNILTVFDPLSMGRKKQPEYTGRSRLVEIRRVNGHLHSYYIVNVGKYQFPFFLKRSGGE